MRRIQWALRSLARQRARVALALIGIIVAAAMLLDMVMLGGGMTVSFRSMLDAQGFELRLAPRGTLPFDSEATIPGAAALRERLTADPRIAKVGMILGAQLYIERATDVIAAAGLGVDPDAQVDYALTTGHDLDAMDDLLVSPALLASLERQVGDTIVVAAGYDPQLRTYTGRRVLVIRGTASFNYLPADRPVAALRLATLQSLGGAATRDRISFAVARLHDGVDAESASVSLERTEPTVSVLSTAQALVAVEERLSYFRQLAFILASVSLAVGFLLVTTIVTVGVHERLGEIAVLRAIGTTKHGVVAQILAEGAVLGVIGALGGCGLGLVTAEWLNSILSGFPGLPAGFDFFVFRARDAWTSLGLLALCGMLAGAVPAWRAASLPIARTLREDAVV